MNATRIFTIIPALLLCSSWAGLAQAQTEAPNGVKPDNTKVNKRDREPGAVTAGQQKMNPADRTLTKKIRQAVIADESLST